MTLELRGTFYDGRSTEPHDVTIRVDDGGAVQVRGDGIHLDVAPADVRVSARLADAPRSITFRDGKKCETRDNDAVDALARALGRRRGAWLHRLESSWRLVLASLLSLVALAAVAFVWGIPFAAKHIARHIPDAIAYRLGEGTLDVLDESLFDESEISQEEEERLRLAFATMAEHVPALPLKLELRRMGVPNAFALPNGTVVITDELVALAESDDELKAVIAHEIGHVEHRHALRMALESSSMALLVSAYIGDATQISALLTALPTVYMQAGYSRSHETEADLYATELMKSASVDRVHFAAILKKLQDAAGPETAGVVQYLSSHPPTSERVARFGTQGPAEGMAPRE